MKILCLYNESNETALNLFDWISQRGHTIIKRSEILDAKWCRSECFDLAVSYTYTHIIKQPVLDALKGNVVNLHISLIPYNRGTYPNIWSILEGTPRGVTLHYIDAGIDSGDIIAQEFVELEDNDTLFTSYTRLGEAAERLFKNAFECYSYWNGLRKKVQGTGTFHNDRQFHELQNHFIDWDWNMSVENFREIVKQRGYLDEIGNSAQ